MYTVHRRTFEAKKHAPGSEERARLNEDNLTSEYMTSYKYTLRENGKHTPFSYTSKAAAEASAEEKNKKLSTNA